MPIPDNGGPEVAELRERVAALEQVVAGLAYGREEPTSRVRAAEFTTPGEYVGRLAAAMRPQG